MGVIEVHGMILGKAVFMLKAEQLDVIKCIYNGKDVFLWLSTGFGKSTVTVEPAVVVA